MMTSERFRMTQGAMLRCLYRFYGRKWAIAFWGIIASFVILFIIFGDVRWLICLLMVALIVMPMVMAFLYIHYGLNPAIAFNVMPHSVTLGNDGVIITVYPKKDEEEKATLNNEEVGKEDSASMPEEPAPMEQLIRFEELNGKYVLGADCVYLMFENIGFIYCPREAFGTSEALLDFLKVVTSKSNYEAIK